MTADHRFARIACAKNTIGWHPLTLLRCMRYKHVQLQSFATHSRPRCALPARLRNDESYLLLLPRPKSALHRDEISSVTYLCIYCHYGFISMQNINWYSRGSLRRCWRNPKSWCQCIDIQAGGMLTPFCCCKAKSSQFVRSLRELWSELPERTRRNVGRRPPQKRRQKKDRSKSNYSQTNASETLEACLPQWTQDPSSFFHESGSMLDFTTQEKAKMVAQIYQYLERLSSRGFVDTIRARFLKILFSRLKERLGSQYLREDRIEDLALIISGSGLVGSDFEVIKSKITRWIDLGRRIDSLCLSIGTSGTDENSHLGNLFHLPELCTDELYAHP